MRPIFTLLFLFFIGTIFGQNKIVGKVFSETSEPLENASVYFNNTSVGVITNNNGSFTIPQPEGAFQLVVSYIGYETISYQLKPDDATKSLVFKLTPQSNMLDEVVIRKQNYDEEWYYNLKRFRLAFIGQSELAKDCEILNPKAIFFSFDSENRILTAETREPLRIENKGLGYVITYDLVSFALSTEKVFFKGYTKYKALEKGRAKMRKWKNARQEAYNGSMMHFFRALQNNTLKEDNFIVNQFKRIPNPARPSDIEIKVAREYLRKYKVAINFSKDVSYPLTKSDSALAIIKKARLPKTLDALYNKNVTYERMFTMHDDVAVLAFENYLSIVYNGEKEERNYLNSGYSEGNRSPGPQTSAMTLLTDQAILDKTGALLDPLAVFVEGYWAFEKLAETLPLDYSPIEK